MAQIVSLLEIVGVVRAATHEGVTDEDGWSYLQLLQEHPRHRQALSERYYGPTNQETVVAELVTLDATLAATLRATDLRGTAAILRRKRLDDSTIVTRMTGVIDEASFTSRGTYRVVVVSQALDVLAVSYPRRTVTATAFPAATSEQFALGLPLPIVLGATREHVPCRYVAADTAFARYRYVAACEVSTAARPWVNSVYSGLTPTAPVLAPAGEYELAYDAPLTDVTLASWSLVVSGAVGPAAGEYAYGIAAYHGCGETAVPVAARKTLTLSGSQGALLTWTAQPLAWGYRIYREATPGTPSSCCLFAEIPDPTLTSWLDTGVAAAKLDTSGATISPALTNSTGLRTTQLAFRKPQTHNNAPVPILADVEATELGLDAHVRGLWLFRGDLRDHSGYHHTPVTWRHRGLWLFQDAVADPPSETFTNTLTGVGISALSYEAGRHGKGALRCSATVRASITDAVQTGLDFDASTSFRVEVVCRPDAGTLTRRMLVCGKRAHSTTGLAGYELMIDRGALRGFVSDGTDWREVVGTVQLDGAWHRLALVVNRVAATVHVEVDGVQDGASASLANLGASPNGAVGSLENAEPFRVCAWDALTDGEFVGLLDEVAVIAGSDAVSSYANGKANQSTNALNLATSTPPYVLDSAQTALDPGSSDWTMEAWIKLTAHPAGGQRAGIVVKLTGLTGYRLALLGDAGASLVEGAAGSISVATGTAVALNVWSHVACVVDQGSTLTTYLNGEQVGIVTGLGTLTLTSSAHCVLGASTVDTATGVATDQFTGLIDEVRLSATARSAAEIRAAYYLGRRNPVRQVRALLEDTVHGPGVTVDATTANAAEAAVQAVESGALVTDGALVEDRPLRDHLTPWLRMRGLRLGLTSAGAWTITADTLRSVVGTFAYKDGVLESIATRPEWRATPLREAVRSLLVRYRRRRDGQGGTGRFVLDTSTRTVLAIGSTQPRVVEMPCLRDRTSADIFAGYEATRAALADQGCRFTAGDDAFSVALGDLITLVDPESGVTSETHEVQGIDEGGLDRTLETGRWSSAIYTYTPGTLPADPAPESAADLSTTPPPQVSALTAAFGSATIDTDGHRVWAATLTWTAPALDNVASFALACRVSGASAWRERGVADRLDTSYVVWDLFDDASTYEFRIVAISPSGLRGLERRTTAATTLPGAPSTPTGLTSDGAGHRSRRWRWDASAAANFKWFEWAVYTASSGPETPPAGAQKSGHTRSTHLTYIETSLSPTALRYLTIRAVNRSGAPSAWTSRVLCAIDGAAVGGGGSTADISPGSVSTGDAAANAFTDANNAAEASGVAIPAGTTVTVVSRSLAANNGVAIVIVEGVMRLGDTGVDPSDVWHKTAYLYKSITKDGASDLVSDELMFGGLRNDEESTVGIYLPFSCIGIDAATGSGTKYYRFKVRQGGVADDAEVFSVRIRVVEFKR